MFPYVLLALCSLGLSSSTRSPPQAHRPYTCKPFTIPVPVNNVTTVVLPFPEITSPYQATYLANVFTERDASAPEVNFATLTKTFTIAGSVCTPNVPNANTSTLHLATHGLGFNRSYWDFYLPATPNDSQYSYVHAATSSGYTVLTWNRLGIAPSTIADPYTEIQASVELSILTTLTTFARQGKIPGLPTPLTRIIHIGHSYGSELTLALAATAPQLSDGIVLTSFSALAQYQNLFLTSTTLHLANLNQPHRFPPSTYSNGFLTWPDQFANQYSFLAFPNFNPAVLAYAEATKYPFTIGEILSAPGLPLSASEFAGPVLWVAAEHDLIFCGFNCTGLFGEESVAVQGTSQGNGGDVEVVIVEGVGHGINLHQGASDKAYARVMDWMGRKF